MKIYKKVIENWPLALLIVLSIVAIIPFFNPGFFSIHDDTQIQRVYEMKRALADGMLPVRWVSDLGYGYGYPIFNFYAPLPYYLGGAISLLGISALLATKLMIAMSIVGAAFSMYLLAREFWGKSGGLLSGVLYLFAPYHALNTYVRGDIGELYAYFFIPLIFYGIWKYYKNPNFKYLLIGVLSYAGLITSHNLSALMVTPFIIFTILVLLFTKKRFSILAIPILGLLLSSFYFIPALAEMNYTNVLKIVGGSTDYKEHFVCIPQIWDSLWMYGGSISGCVDGLSFRLGKIHIIFSIFSVFLAVLLLKKEKLKAGIAIISFLSLVLSLFFMIDLSKSIWASVPYMNFFQFPWRFLLLASFFSSFIGGSLIFFIPKFFSKKKYRWTILVIGFIFVLLPVIFYSKLFVPQEYINKTSNEYTSKEFLNWTTSQISDEYMPKSFNIPSSREQIAKERISGENIIVSNLTEKTTMLSAEIKATKKSSIVIHIAYFPGWNYYLNDKKIEVRETDSGVSMSIPEGKHKLLAKFEQTPIENLANLLSLAGIVALIVGIIYAKSKKSKK